MDAPLKEYFDTIEAFLSTSDDYSYSQKLQYAFYGGAAAFFGLIGSEKVAGADVRDAATCLLNVTSEIERALPLSIQSILPDPPEMNPALLTD